MTDNEVDSKTDDVIAKLVRGFIDNGKLLIIGLGGHGKTIAAMHIVRRIMNMKEYLEKNVIINLCDTVGIWKWKFDAVPYVNMVKSSSIDENEQTQTILLDLGFSDPDLNTQIIENLVRGDFIQQRDMLNNSGGQLLTRRIYIIEEIQNVLGTYALSGNSGKFWLKEVSEGRNYGQYIIGVGQRLGDISPKIVERTRYFLFGAISGENDANKIKHMFGSKGRNVVNTLMGLKRGEFLFVDKENMENSWIIYFPDFIQNGSPYEYGVKNRNSVNTKRIFL